METYLNPGLLPAVPLKPQQLRISVAVKGLVPKRCLENTGALQVEPRVKLVSHTDATVNLDQFV